MTKQATGNSVEGPADNIITVTTSILPPERRGCESGKFNFSIRRTITDPTQLLDPIIGGTLLREQSSWDPLPPEVKSEIQPGMLEFIAKDPIPPDEEIDAEILTRSNIVIKQLEVKKSLFNNPQLPDVIAVAINSQLEQEIADNPSLSLSNLLAETQRLAEDAISQIQQTSFMKEHASGRYCLIAHDILNRRRTKSSRNTSDLKENADEEESDTIPGTPYAIKEHRRH